MYGTSTLLTPLKRRWRRFARLRALLLQGAVGLTGLLLITLPPAAERIWHDVGATVLLAAVTLRVWRAPEEGLPDPLRFRRLHRAVCWRVGTALLLGGTLALVANRWLLARHEGGGAHTVAVLGGVSAGLGVLAAVVERPLWRLWPTPVRRAAATAEALEKISRNQPITARPLAGLPEPVLHRPAGTPSPHACSTFGRKRDAVGRVVLRWDGRHLIVVDRYGTAYEVPIPGQPRDLALAYDARLRPLGELVWCSYVWRPPYRVPRATLLLLDTDGRCFAELTGPRFGRQAAVAVARAAGVAFTAHDLSFAGVGWEELLKALYPRRGRVFRLRDDRLPPDRRAAYGQPSR
ncbi:hypothetical protein [Streptacidiphilus sp. P02-A3a]|uniref:hypothetical protein n=1 Tax=Streptacidiphilus sp. P02-A3a TaxID=2704468 RepID=UPI0015FDC6E4|nr:hypothetical protein [Streptacidiphilus sp. P02-A3a]QMU68020.1 hypothetical protein GXP74_07115 [Streptacidiphilus sp. P02-A3a]